jgi:hypothetical protein
MPAIDKIEAIFCKQDLDCLKVDGKATKLPAEQVSTKLQSANEMQRSLFRISPSKYGIY